MEDLKKSFYIRGGNVVGALGDKNFSTAPLGTVLSFAGQTAPYSYLLCDGASYKVADYPHLYAVIGNTYGGDSTNFNVPDFRETVLVGVGENTTDTIADHDVYGLGEFKDDQLQGHWHNLGNSNGTVTVALGASAKGGSVTGASVGAENRYTVDTALDAITDGTNGEPRKGTTTHGKQKGVTYIIKAFHTNEGVDSGVSDDVVDYVDNKVDELISDTTTNTNSTWSSNMIASQINNATAIKYNNVIGVSATKETDWNLAQGESHFYGRLLQLDGHLGSKSSTFSFLLFVKANYDNPITVYVTQLAGMDDDRSNISHTTYFELGVSSSGNLTITNKSAVVASYRFI